MKNNKYIAIIAASLTTAFLACLICTVYIYSLRNKQETVKTVYEQQYVYVEVTKESSATSEPENEDNGFWIVKEHFGMIGIFDENGALTEVIEIYTKTLPETDRALLREGIKVTSRQSLDALIEDYGS